MGQGEKGKRREGQVFFAVGFFSSFDRISPIFPFPSQSLSRRRRGRMSKYAPPTRRGKSVKGSGAFIWTGVQHHRRSGPLIPNFLGENVFSGQVGSLGGDRSGGPAGHVRRFQLRARGASAATSEGHIPVRLAGQFFLCCQKA